MSSGNSGKKYGPYIPKKKKKKAPLVLPPTNLIYIKDNPFIKGEKTINFYNDVCGKYVETILNRDLQIGRVQRRHCLLPTYKYCNNQQDQSFKLKRKYDFGIQGGQPYGSCRTDGFYLIKEKQMTKPLPKPKKCTPKRKKKRKKKKKKKLETDNDKQTISSRIKKGQYLPIDFSNRFIRVTRTPDKLYKYTPVSLSLIELREYIQREKIKCRIAAAERKRAKIEKRKLKKEAKAMANNAASFKKKNAF